MTSKQAKNVRVRTSTKKSSSVSSVTSDAKPVLDQVRPGREPENPVQNQLQKGLKTKSKANITNAIDTAQMQKSKAPIEGDWGKKESGISAAPRPAVDAAPRTEKQFFIKALNSTLSLDYSPDMTIGEVRAKIRQKQPHLTDDFSLKFGIKTLQDHYTLNDLGIQQNSTVHLSLKLKGGTPDWFKNPFRRNARLNIGPPQAIQPPLLANGMVNGPNGLNIPAAPRLGFRAPRDNNGVYLTSRSIVLNEELTSHSLEMTGNRAQWNSGSYMAGLAITHADLQRWAQPGANGPPARVLDVAGGGSVFPEEVRALNGLPVDAVDINHAQYRQRLTAANPALAQRVGLPAQNNPTTRDALAAIYMRNMDRLHQMHLATNDVIPPGDQAMFNQLYAARQQIAQQAHDGQTIQRSAGNAVALQNIQNDQYGVYLNSWMMNYLSPADRVDALREAIRVVAPGGEIRIQGGQLDAEGSRPGPLHPHNMIPAPPPPPAPPPAPVAQRRRGFRPFRRTVQPPPPPPPQVAQEAANAPASGPAQFRRWFAGQLQQDGSYLIHNKNVRIDPRSTNTLLVLTIDP